MLVLLLLLGRSAAAPRDGDAHDTARRALSAGELDERAALMELYNATRGQEWLRRDNWSTGVPVCAWFGVDCDARGRVTTLDVQSNNLRGPLPAVLSNLTSMQHLCVMLPPLSILLSSSSRAQRRA